MNLAKLFQYHSYHTHLNLNELEVKSIADDSRLVKSGDLFFARPGSSVDGAAYIQEALNRGAIAIVSEENLEIKCLIKVESVLNSLDILLKNFHNQPLERLVKYAVTGTNGKTTTAFIIDHVLSSFQNNILTGTIHNKIAGKIIDSVLTTPGIVEFYQILSQGILAKCQSISLELSSHAIEQNRLGTIKLDAAIFTNLSQDHLDYHGDMQTYFEAKLRMFQEYLSDKCIPIINIDDEYGQKICNIIDSEYWSYGLGQKTYDIFILEDLNPRGPIELNLQTPCGVVYIKTHLIGDFNKENLMGAVGALLTCGVSIDKIQKGLETVCVPGRLEVVATEKGHVVIDYAHTPDALSRVLDTLREICQGKLIVVFGCGGDRDKSKRATMGSVAVNNADIIFVTSDNPRTEDQLEIIKDIMKGIPDSKQAYVEADRRSAIAQALGVMGEYDIVLIAGKGHEDYQIIGTEKFHFDDKEIVQEFIGGTNGT